MSEELLIFSTAFNISHTGHVMMVDDSLRESTASKAAEGPDGLPEAWFLAVDKCHVWCAYLDEFSGKLPRFYGMLSDGERFQAVRFRFQEDRDHFVIRRGLLRTILGLYLRDSPASIAFCDGPNGKPALASPAGAETLHFNLSHSCRLAVYAITRAVPLGVDVERIRPMNDMQEIASRFFTAHENALLRAIPLHQRLKAFFNCWTRKEACLKATGQGIGEGLAGVEVTLAPSRAARVLSIMGSAQAAAGWSLHALEPATGYVCAVAYRGQRLEMECRTFSLSIMHDEACGMSEANWKP